MSEETIIQIIEGLKLEDMPQRMTKEQKLKMDTDGFIRFEDNSKHIIVKGEDDRVLIHLIPSSSEIEYILTFVENAWEKLWKSCAKISPKEGNRGFYWVFHICCWRKYSDIPFMSTDSQIKKSVINKFIKVMKPICQYIEALLKQQYEI